MQYEIKRYLNAIETVVKTITPQGGQQREAMGVDVVDMTFELATAFDFQLNDFVDVYGLRYKLNRLPQVQKISKKRFAYAIQFEAEHYDLGKVQYQFLNPTNQLLEPTFDLTGSAETFIDLLVQNANRHSAGWTIGEVDETEYITLSFNAQNCLQVLNQLTDQFKTEFWIENKTVHLQKREQSSGYTFKYGKGNGLYNINRQNKSNADVFTRLYVRGGSRNLPAGYISTSLLLDNDETYIQDNAKVAQYGLIEAPKIFADIYPNRVGTVTGIVAGNDNWEYFFDTTLDFDINDQAAPGLDAKVHFNSGQLAGYSFTFSYNHSTKRFRLNKNTEETAIDIPSNLLRPAIGDKYVLWDIIMPETYVAAAKVKLANAANAYYNENSDAKSLLAYSASCDPLFISTNNINVVLGSTAILEDDDLDINTELRIAKFVRDLQNPNLYTTLEWSDTIGRSEIIRQYQQQQKTLLLLESSGLLSVEQMRKNLFLNRLSEQNGFLMLSGNKIKAGHSDYADDAAHAHESDHALDSDKWAGRQFADYLDQPLRKTDAVKFASVVADTVNSTVYVSGFSGSGYRINPDGSAEFDSLTVRKELNINVLNVREITGNGGSLAITNVAKIDSVSDEGSYYRCLINSDGGAVSVQLSLYDIIRCQIWDGKNLKFYTAKIINVGSDFFEFYKSDMTGTGVPAAGDTVFQFGNTTDTNRQGLIYLTNSDSGAPYIDVLDGITSDNLAGKTKVRLGNLNGINDADFGQLQGYGLYAQNAYLINGKFKGVVEVTGGNAATLTQVANAKVEAISAATADASAKANAAQLNAVSQAATTAQEKADAAQAAAVNLSKQLVDNLSVGGRNYVLGSSMTLSSTENSHNWGLLNLSIASSMFSGRTITISVDYELKNATHGPGHRIGAEIAFQSQNLGMIYIGAWFYPSSGYNGKGRVSSTAILPSDIVAMPAMGIYIQCGGDFTFVGRPKVEFGNKATDWTPAPEDVQSSIDNATALANAAQAANTALVNNLKSMAYQDVVELAKLGNTIIEGGHIKLSLLDAIGIRSYIVNATYVNTLDLDASAIKSGTMDSERINAAEIIVRGGGRKNLLFPDRLNLSAGSDIAVTDYSRFAASLNGGASQSRVELGIDPFGKTSLLWKCIEVTNVNAEAGGFHSLEFLTDGSKAYRFSFAFKQNGYSSFYLGASQYGATMAINGGVSNNPYFCTGAGYGGQWLLAVGYLLPHNTDQQSNMSGIYSFETGEKIADGVDWRASDYGQLYQYMRAYQYYASYGAVTYIYNPMVELIDGSEPSIATLLGRDAITLAIAKNATALANAAQAANTALVNNLKSLAYQDFVELAKLGNTIIEGGHIKLSLLDAIGIRSYIVNADYVNTLDLVSKTIRTAAAGIKRIEITADENNLRLYDSQNIVLAELDDDSALDGFTIKVNDYPLPPTITPVYGPGFRVGAKGGRSVSMSRKSISMLNDAGALQNFIGVDASGNSKIILDARGGMYVNNWSPYGDAGPFYNVRLFPTEIVVPDWGTYAVIGYEIL